MNTKFKIGHLFLSAAVLSLVLTASCKQQPKNEDTKEVAEDVNDATETATDSVTDARNDDSDYLIAAAETDMMEIELGKLALKKTTNARVKELANMMIDQHTKASATLKSLATAKQVAIPAALTDKGKEAYDDLDKKTGRDFDDAYADKMVDGHEDAISKIKDASQNAKDAEIRQWAADMLPTLNTHLEHSKMLQDQIKKTK
jgi:putative membrane protein